MILVKIFIIFLKVKIQPPQGKVWEVRGWGGKIGVYIKMERTPTQQAPWAQ